MNCLCTGGWWVGLGAMIAPCGPGSPNPCAARRMGGVARGGRHEWGRPPVAKSKAFYMYGRCCCSGKRWMLDHASMQGACPHPPAL